MDLAREPLGESKEKAVDRGVDAGVLLGVVGRDVVEFDELSSQSTSTAAPSVPQ